MFRASSAHLQDDTVVHMQHMVVTLYESSWWPVGTQLEWELTEGGRLLVGVLRHPRGGVGPRAGLDGAENLAPTGIRSLGLPARSESLSRPLGLLSKKSEFEFVWTPTFENIKHVCECDWSTKWIISLNTHLEVWAIDRAILHRWNMHDSRGGWYLPRICQSILACTAHPSPVTLTRVLWQRTNTCLQHRIWSMTVASHFFAL